MKRLSFPAILGAAALSLLATTALAEKGTDHFNFGGGGPDNGTCGTWADTSYNLGITVHDNGDGTFAVRTDYRGGSFVTRAGSSPGACQAETPHGVAVVAGIKGTLKAWVEETITSDSYDPAACDTGGGPGHHDGGPCSSRSGFIAAVFGCNEGTCADGDSFAWDFTYTSHDQRLIYATWDDAWPSRSPDEFAGDIATQ